MRIVVIGYIRGDASQNGVRMLQAFSLQGHSVLGLDFGDPFLLAKVLKFKPAVTLVTMGREFDHTALNVLRADGIYLVNWIPDEYGPEDGTAGEWFEKIRGVYDLLMLETRGLVPLLEDYARNVMWVPQFFDQYYHSSRDPLFPPPWDAGFLGGPNTAQSTIRVKFLANLVKDGYDLRIGGSAQWHDHKMGNAVIDGMLVGGQMCAFYKNTRISVNFLNDLLPQYDLGLSNRAFKTVGCGCFLLTPEISGLEDLLTPEKHCITYKGDDYQDFKDKIDYYLENQQERLKIAATGQSHVLKNYNIGKVTADFLSAIKERM